MNKNTDVKTAAEGDKSALNNLVMPLLQPMETAPKDGAWILVVWRTDGDEDINHFDIRLARWWKPTDLDQWERGARPHWEYIDNSGCRDIYKPNGWMPQPKLLEA